MPTQYTITVKNEGKHSKAFMLFVDQPVFNSTSESTVWSNVYMKSKAIPGPQGSVKFTFFKDFYAVCGTTSIPLGDGGMVETGDSEIVNLKQGTNPGTVVALKDDAAKNEAPYVDVAPVAVATAVATAVTPGAFAYMTGKDIVQDDPRNIFIGLGAKNEDGDVIPIATINPEPSTQYIVTPKNKYYINTGAMVEGKIMNYVQSVSESATIDFTGKTQTKAIVTIDASNTWVVTYKV